LPPQRTNAAPADPKAETKEAPAKIATAKQTELTKVEEKPRTEEKKTEAKPQPKEPEQNLDRGFSWPIEGKVISNFGPKGEGLNNDGINIAAPKGSPVAAADGGIVVYAGNEMKGFGNLILIRHEDGWITAYAHLDRMLVTKDSVVGRGDMIATVGKTGGVSSPQLHFEIRKDGRPMDPVKLLR
jgi:murein DD-endopeptidase MepM/ murein hydrolase activator NlpD